MFGTQILDLSPFLHYSFMHSVPWDWKAFLGFSWLPWQPSREDSSLWNRFLASTWRPSGEQVRTQCLPDTNTTIVYVFELLQIQPHTKFHNICWHPHNCPVNTLTNKNLYNKSVLHSLTYPRLIFQNLFQVSCSGLNKSKESSLQF